MARVAEPGPMTFTPVLNAGSADSSVIVPVTPEKVIVPPPASLAARMADLSEPAPESLLVVTTTLGAASVTREGRNSNSITRMKLSLDLPEGAAPALLYGFGFMMSIASGYCEPGAALDNNGALCPRLSWLIVIIVLVPESLFFNTD